MDTPTKSPKRQLALIGAAVAVAAIIIVVIVSRARGSGELTLYGNVDIRDVTVGFRVPGRLAQLDVDEGAAVHSGQELARLDTTPLQLELDESHANAQSLGRHLALLRSGYRPEQVAQARAAVAEAQAALGNAQQQLSRQEQLRGTGAVAARAYDDALAARDEAQARLQSAQEGLDQQQRGYRSDEIAEAEANHARAQAVASQAQQRLADAVLRAPADGIVLTRAVEPGAILGAGAAVFTISLRAPVWARIYVSEPDLGKLNPGREVLLYTDSRPDRPYHGRIGFVSPTAEFTPKNVETPDLRTALVYRARVVVTDADDALRQGMPVTVRLAAASASGARAP